MLKKHGFNHVLLVTGESSKQVGVDYLTHALELLRPHFANLSIEVQPLDISSYRTLMKHGMHAVMVYQETYNQQSYARHHLKGKKQIFNGVWIPQTGLDKRGLTRLDLAVYLGLHLSGGQMRYTQAFI